MAIGISRKWNEVENILVIVAAEGREADRIVFLSLVSQLFLNAVSILRFSLGIE